MNHKKDIDVCEHVTGDCKQLSLNHYEVIKELTDNCKKMECENIALCTKIDSLHLEAKCNEENLCKNHDLFNMLNEKYQECNMRIVEADTEIC